jgi:hypothetical protein
VLAGTVTSRNGRPLSGATVFIPSRWWDRKLGLLSQVYNFDPSPFVQEICDVDGHYRIVMDAPFMGILVVEKSGFAQQYDEVDLLSAGEHIRNFVLTTANACVEGSVSDQNGRRLSGANLYAVSATGDSSISSPLVTKSDSMGRYRIDSVPNATVMVAAIAERHLPESRLITFGDEGCARCDFSLKNAVDVRLKIIGPQGEAISYANACGRILSNEKGEVILPLPVGSLPFDCPVSAPGYREKHVTLYPEGGVATIILDRGGPFIKGHVLTESGVAVENAKVSVEASGTVYTDKDGGYEIPLRHGGHTIIVAYKAGYVESRQSLNIEGAGLTDNIIVMLTAKGGIYGRVVGFDGSPVQRFRIELIRAGNLSYIYDREFENPNGMFYVNDVPAGEYSCRIVPNGQAPTNRYISFLIPKIQIKDNHIYGEMDIALEGR